MEVAAAVDVRGRRAHGRARSRLPGCRKAQARVRNRAMGNDRCNRYPSDRRMAESTPACIEQVDAIQERGIGFYAPAGPARASERTMLRMYVPTPKSLIRRISIATFTAISVTGAATRPAGSN